MTRLLKVLVLMLVMSSAATSHPFGHRDASRRTDFEWNSRKIGSRRVATVRIRKDEERDRRSILVGDDDDDDSFRKTHHDPAGGHGRRRHAHRHHHGEEAPDAVWVSTGDAEGGAGVGRSPGRRHRGQSSRRVATSSLNDRNLNDIQPEDLPLLLEALDDAGVDLSQYLVHNATTTARPQGRKQRGNRSGGGRKRTKSKNKKNKKKKNKKKKGGRKKGSKACRALKGRQKKNCREAFKKCRRLRGREKKRCRAEASQAVAAAAGDDMFSFITPSIEMSGSEACQYHHLTECCKQVGLLSHATDSLRPVDKCFFREEFLKCMEAQREGTCEPSFHTRGNMTALRNKIREVIWTNNSCLISEVEEG